jgi:H+/gluconate symporter-like permease
VTNSSNNDIPITGIVIGVVLAILCCIVLFVVVALFIRRRKQQRQRDQQESEMKVKNKMGSDQYGSVNDVMAKPSNNYQSSAIVAATSPSINRYILSLSLTHTHTHTRFFTYHLLFLRFQ